jgi:hypothetical protein
VDLVFQRKDPRISPDTLPGGYCGHGEGVAANANHPLQVRPAEALVRLNLLFPGRASVQQRGQTRGHFFSVHEPVLSQVALIEEGGALAGATVKEKGDSLGIGKEACMQGCAHHRPQLPNRGEDLVRPEPGEEHGSWEMHSQGVHDLSIGVVSSHGQEYHRPDVAPAQPARQLQEARFERVGEVHPDCTGGEIRHSDSWREFPVQHRQARNNLSPPQALPVRFGTACDQAIVGKKVRLAAIEHTDGVQDVPAGHSKSVVEAIAGRPD